MTTEEVHLSIGTATACGEPEKVYVSRDPASVNCRACLLAEVERLRGETVAVRDGQEPPRWVEVTVKAQSTQEARRIGAHLHDVTEREEHLRALLRAAGISVEALEAGKLGEALDLACEFLSWMSPKEPPKGTHQRLAILLRGLGRLP